MTFQEANKLLEAIGRRLGEYHQSERIKGNDVLLQTVGTGMCNGACLEWLRMVLHGLNGNLGPGDRGAVRAQLRVFSKDEFMEKRKTQLDQVLANLRQKFDLEWDERTEAVNKKLKTLETVPGMTQAKINQLAALLYAALNESNNAAQAQQDARFALLQESRMNKSLNQTFWTDFAKELDTKLNTGTHSFASLAVDKAYTKKTVYGPPNGLLELVNRVVDHRKLRAGCGAVLVVCPPSLAVGHAVAIHRLNTSKFRLFDPNFGVYEFDSYNVRKAILILFLRVYPELKEGNRPAQDAHVYQVNGQCGGDFMIYRGPGMAPPAVKTLPPSNIRV